MASLSNEVFESCSAADVTKITGADITRAVTDSDGERKTMTEMVKCLCFCVTSVFISVIQGGAEANEGLQGNNTNEIRMMCLL